MSDVQETPAPQPQRPKLQLKPRDPEAAAKLEAERQQSGKNPFGAAKPREQIIASREGKSETEILLDEVKKEKLHLRLDGAQLEEKRTIEAELKDLESKLAAEEDAAQKEELKKQVDACQTKLDDLIERFAKATLETALSGEAPRVSQVRRQQGPPQHMPHPGGRYNPTEQYSGPPQRGHYDRRGGYNQRYSGGGGGHYREHQQGGGYRDQQLPEWARDSSPHQGHYGGRGGYYQGGGGGFDRQSSGGGGYASRYQQPGGNSSNDGYGDSSDQGFFDQPSSFNGGSYNRGGRGRGGGGRGGYHRSGSGGRGGGQYGGAGYNGGAIPRGVGGEIEYDDDFGDRY